MATTTVARVDLRFESPRRRILYPELDQVVFLTRARGERAEPLRSAFGTRDGLTPVMAMFGVVLALALFSAYMDARVTPGTERKIAMVFAFAAWMASTFVVFSPGRGGGFPSRAPRTISTRRRRDTRREWR